jgi:hypothetical protein
MITKIHAQTKKFSTRKLLDLKNDHWDKKWKSLCDNPVCCTTQPIYCPGVVRQTTSKIHAQMKNFSTRRLTLS